MLQPTARPFVEIALTFALLVILDPPHVLFSAIDPSDTNSFPDPASFDIVAKPDIATDETTPKAWWTANSDRTEYRGLEVTLPYVREHLNKAVNEGKAYDVSDLTPRNDIITVKNTG